MTKIERSNIWEETRYAFECPKCGEYNEVCDVSDIYECEECHELIEVDYEH